MYVHVNEINKPWIDKISSSEIDGYIPAPGLMDYQILALNKYPDKCYLDNNGVVHAPNDLPIDEQEMQKINMNELETSVKLMKTDITNLSQDKNDLEKQRQDLIDKLNASENINRFLMQRLNEIGQNVNKIMQNFADQVKKDGGATK